MGAVENMKELADFVKRFNDIELNRRILKLEDEVLDLSRDKRRGEDRIEELERAFKFKGELHFKGSFYWQEGDAYPYCPGCWDSKKAANHVLRTDVHKVGLQILCPVCKHNFGRPSFPWPDRATNTLVD